jgi:hypothetical protein
MPRHRKQPARDPGGRNGGHQLRIGAAAHQAVKTLAASHATTQVRVVSAAILWLETLPEEKASRVIRGLK